jgi:FMN phosphatase YigB (HAD superfamily)
VPTQKTALITDFDNTLYDWFHTWYQSFNAMLGEIERISGIDRAVLMPEIRTIHQRYRTSEYSFLIESIPTLRRKYEGQNLNEIFDSAIHAYRSARNKSLRLYDGVADALSLLRSNGVLIVVYTDSLAFYTTDRIKRLGLEGLIDFLYSPPDHEIPSSITSHTMQDKYQFKTIEHRFLREGEQKPNPEVLRDIVASIGRPIRECVYIGDSLIKDIAMAQDAGITDVLAKYGRVQDSILYCP